MWTVKETAEEINLLAVKMGVAAPFFLMTLFWGGIGGVAPFFLPKESPNRGLLQVITNTEGKL